MRYKEKFKPFVIIYEGFLKSFSQVFFSERKVLAIIILIVTFFNVNTGICAITGVLSAILISYAMGFNRYNIASGYYGFNALLVSLGIGAIYEFNFELFVVLFFAAFLSVMLTLMMEGVIGKYRLPYLSLPFLLTLWLVTLAARNFSALSLSEIDNSFFDGLHVSGLERLLNLNHLTELLSLPEFITVYFKSLGAIFFQYNVIAGILLAIGILIYSRQAFILSIVGYTSAYFYYIFIGASINDLYYNYIGFNFILTAIALGGFFIIPSVYSYMFVILLTPVISVFLVSTATVFATYNLSVFSLPFNLMVILFLYILRFRESRQRFPLIVNNPKGTPEENLYFQHNELLRFSKNTDFHFELPFRGEWKVTQAHNGALTHKDKWRHAWDFVIVDGEGKEYGGFGLLPDNFYCYNKPVLAPADGVVESIVYNIPYNEIGDVNTENNWGNTIIIRHAPFVFSKLSHLKAGTFKVAQGEFVKKGQILANVGNSGRSPTPHLHFQFQSLPHIGSETIDIPFSHYIFRNTYSNQLQFTSFDRPALNEFVSNLNSELQILKAMHFTPGQVLPMLISSDNGKKISIQWEVITDYLNRTYIYCSESKSKAFIYNDGRIHYFTNFEGNRHSLLYMFYLGAYKIISGFYKGLEFQDEYPLHKLIGNNPILWIQDCVAPFLLFVKGNYSCLHFNSFASIELETVHLKTVAKLHIFGFLYKKIEFEIIIEEKRIKSFSVTDKNSKIIAQCCKD